MPPRSREARSLPAGLLLARSPRMEREPLRLLPRASLPRSYPRSTPRRRQALAHWPEYYTYGISRTSKRCLLLHSCTLISHVVAGGFDDHTRDLLGDQMLTQCQDLRGRSAPGRHRRRRSSASLALDSDTDLRVFLRAVDARASRVHHIHPKPPPSNRIDQRGVFRGERHETEF
jgi:hypothetical protein